MLKNPISILLILISILTVLQAQNYTYSGQFLIPGLQSAHMLANSEVLVHTNTSIYVSHSSNLSKVLRTVLVSNENATVPKMITPNYFRKEFYYPRNNKLHRYTSREIYNSFRLVNSSKNSPFVKSKDNIFYMTKKNERMMRYNLNDQKTYQGPILKTNFSDQDYDTEMTLASNGLIAIGQWSEFMITDENMSLIQDIDKSFVYGCDKHSLSFQSDNKLIIMLADVFLLIKRFNETSKKYDNTLYQVDRTYRQSRDIACFGGTRFCRQLAANQNGTLLMKWDLDLDKKGEVLVSELQRYRPFLQYINENRNELMSIQTQSGQVEVFSIEKQKFDLIKTFKLGIVKKGYNQYAVNSFARNGSLLIYSYSTVWTKNPNFGVFDVSANRSVCFLNITKDFSFTDDTFYDSQTELFYCFRRNANFIHSLDTRTCRLNASYEKNYNEASFNTINFLSNPKKMYLTMTSKADNSRKILELDRSTLQILNTYNFSAENQIFITRKGESRMLGTRKIAQGRYLLVLYNLNFTQQLTKEVICFNSGIQLRPGKNFFRVICSGQHIIYDSDTFQIINDYLTNQDLNFLSPETFSPNLTIRFFAWLYNIDRNLYNRSMVELKGAYKQERIYRGRSLIQLDQSTLLSLQQQKSSGDVFIVKEEIDWKSNKILTNKTKTTKNLPPGFDPSGSVLKPLCKKYFTWRSNNKIENRLFGIFDLDDMEFLYGNLTNWFQPQSKQLQYGQGLSFYLDCEQVLYIKDSNQNEFCNAIDVQQYLPVFKPKAIYMSGIMAGSNKGDRIALHGRDSSSAEVIEEWNITSESFIASYKLPNAGELVSKIAFSPNDQRLLVLKNLKLYELVNSQAKQLPTSALDFFFITDDLLLLKNTKGELTYFSFSSSSISTELPSLTYELLAMSPSRKMVLSKLQSQSLVELHNISEQTLIKFQTLESKLSQLSQLLANDNGTILLVSSSGQKIETWVSLQCAEDKIIKDGKCICDESLGFSYEDLSENCQRTELQRLQHELKYLWQECIAKDVVECASNNMEGILIGVLICAIILVGVMMAIKKMKSKKESKENKALLENYKSEEIQA